MYKCPQCQCWMRKVHNVDVATHQNGAVTLLHLIQMTSDCMTSTCFSSLAASRSTSAASQFSNDITSIAEKQFECILTILSTLHNFLILIVAFSCIAAYIRNQNSVQRRLLQHWHDSKPMLKAYNVKSHIRYHI